MLVSPRSPDSDLLARRTDMRAVELSVKPRELADTYEHMRIWLDHEHCVPVDFDQTGDRTGIVHIRVSFEKDKLAEAFQREFAVWQA
jgi:hypothetical protein